MLKRLRDAEHHRMVSPQSFEHNKSPPILYWIYSTTIPPKEIGAKIKQTLSVSHSLDSSPEGEPVDRALALSVTCGDSSPQGRALGKTKSSAVLPKPLPSTDFPRSGIDSPRSGEKCHRR